MKKVFLILLFCVPFAISSSAFDLNSAAFSINSATKGINNISDIQTIEKLLDDFELAWNQQDSEKVSNFYADIFVNGDGLNYEQVKDLTKELWQAYPDIKTTTQSRTIRIYGDYATVESTDIYQGTTQGKRDDVDSKGTLKAVSVGEIYLKRFGPKWKITSDKTTFEKVGIGYGIGNELIDNDQLILSAPEQVYSGKNYTASLIFTMSREYKAVASISKELLVYPQASALDKFRLVDSALLERLFAANTHSKNELISATVGITGGLLEPKLVGLVFLTRRVNVIPLSSNNDTVKIVNEKASNALVHTKANDFFYPDSDIQTDSFSDLLIEPNDTSEKQYNFEQ